MRTLQRKLNGVKIVTVRVDMQRVRDVYTKGIIWSLTTKGSTGQVLYAMYQLGWSVNMRIVHDNHLDISTLILHKLF